MARHLYVYEGHGYEGELTLYRHAHVSAGRAEGADLPGLRPCFLFRVTDDDGQPPLITDDEIAVRRHLADHPLARVSIVPMVR